jgi:hypothetical protein
MPDAITDLLTDDGFRTGLVYGLLAAGAVAAGAAASRRTLPLAGVAVGVAAYLALAGAYDDVGSNLAVGLVALGTGGLLTARSHPLLRIAASLPGALLVADSTGLDRPAWAMPAVVAVSAVGGTLVAETDRALGRLGVPPVLLAVTALGIYGTTPDTEHAMVTAGVALAVAPLGLPWPDGPRWPLASLGAAGAPVVGGVVAWTVVVDGLARPGAVVGGVACLGLLALEPVVRWSFRAHGLPQPTPGRRLRDQVVVVSVQLGLVAVCSRVAGLRTSAAEALVISAVAYVAAAIALRALGARARDASDTGP